MQTLDPRMGGVAQAVLSLGKGLSQLGVEVETAVQDPPQAAWLEKTPLPVHPLGRGRTPYHYSAALRRWLEAHVCNYDCAIGHGLWQHHGFALRQAFRAAGKPYYIFPHGMLDPWFKKIYPAKHLKKWLFWPWADYRVLRDARATIFTSEEERRQARQSFWLYRAAEAVSPLGVEAPASPNEDDVAAFRSKFPQARGKRILLFLGRLHPKKGCDLLIEAFRNSGDEFVLVVAGPDQVGWQQSLRNKTDARRVIFPGMLEGSVKWAALAAADALVLPSHQENFGVAAIEALSQGTPLLLSNRVNIWREIEETGAGYIDHDTLPGVSRLLTRWEQTSPPAREIMRARARHCFQQHFTLSHAARSLLAILETT